MQQRMQPVITNTGILWKAMQSPMLAVMPSKMQVHAHTCTHTYTHTDTHYMIRNTHICTHTHKKHSQIQTYTHMPTHTDILLNTHTEKHTTKHTHRHENIVIILRYSYNHWYTRGLLVETVGCETDWEVKPGVPPQRLSPHHNPMEWKALPWR